MEVNLTGACGASNLTTSARRGLGQGVQAGSHGFGGERDAPGTLRKPARQWRPGEKKI